MSTEATFLDCSIRRLEKSCAKIEACLEKIPEERIWFRAGENQNAVGNLMLHLCGNIRQWILSGVFGDPDHRDRDAEFAARTGPGKAELRARLRAVVDETKSRLSSMPPQALADRIRPQEYEVSKLEAIYHVVEHLAGHCFQIIFVTKLLTGEDLGFYAHLSPNAPKAPNDPTP
jgi:uncharacterized damage-inducible protein DinB